MQNPQRQTSRPLFGLLLSLNIWLGLAFLNASPAVAHGTEIALTDVQALEIVARFDSGDPMAGAQVVVYAPSDADTPWLTGTADESGRFTFTPDRSQPGEWAIQVRTAGHGDWVYAELDGSGATAVAASDGGFTTAQIILMSAAGIWGFIGTALYFARPRSKHAEPQDNPALAA